MDLSLIFLIVSFLFFQYNIDNIVVVEVRVKVPDRAIINRVDSPSS
jgi:hypothetical protein